MSQPLVTDEEVEFEKKLVQVQDCRQLLIILEKSMKHTSN